MCIFFLPLLRAHASLCIAPNGDWISSGEDGSVRVWRGGECVQHMPQPCLSVWAVAIRFVWFTSLMPALLVILLWVVTTARCAFSRARRSGPAPPLRWQRTTWSCRAWCVRVGQARFCDSFHSHQQIGDLATSGLPGRSALSQPGRREGDSLLVSHAGRVEAYQVCPPACSRNVQWTGGAWTLTGEVTDAVDHKDDTTFYIELDGRVGAWLRH